MRLLSGQVKRLIAVFAVITVACLSLVGVAVAKVVGGQDESYTVSADSVIYDNAYNPVELEEDGVVSKSWDGSYYLSSGGTKYSLGSRNVVYMADSSEALVLGGGYQIYEDSSVRVLDDFTTVSCLTSNYVKMSDKDYLITGDSITDSGGYVETTDYLYMSLDSSNNTRLMSIDINVKIVGTVSVSNDSGLTYDPQESTLAIGDALISVANAISSYASSGEGTVITSDDAVDGVYDITIAGGNGGAGGNGLSNNNVTVSTSSTYMYLRSVEPGTTTVDVSYVIVDNVGEYAVPTILVYPNTSTYTSMDADTLYGCVGNGEVIAMIVSADSSAVEITGLTYGTRYIMAIGNADNGSFTALDTVSFTTGDMSASIAISSSSTGTVTNSSIPVTASVASDFTVESGYSFYIAVYGKNVDGTGYVLYAAESVTGTDLTALKSSSGLSTKLALSTTLDDSTAGSTVYVALCYGTSYSDDLSADDVETIQNETQSYTIFTHTFNQ